MSETNRRKTKYLAHIRENERQTIEEHLEGTAKHAEQFAAAFGGESYARTAGWYHDIGKCSDAFLTRLLEQGPKVDHASAGAYELQRQGQMIEAMCVAGHHSGLLDMGNVNVPKTGTFAGRIQKVQNKQVPTYQIPEMIKQQPIVCPYPVDILTSPFSISFFTRFLFSCLVDADFLDTEQFMTGVARTPTTGLSELLDHSAARGEMNVRGLYIWKHDSLYGKAHAHRIFDTLKIEKKADVIDPTSFSDYMVSVDETALPDSVTMYKYDV